MMLKYICIAFLIFFTGDEKHKLTFNSHFDFQGELMIMWEKMFKMKIKLKKRSLSA